MGTGGCIALRLPNGQTCRYYVTHDGYRSGFGRAVAMLLKQLTKRESSGVDHLLSIAEFLHDNRPRPEDWKGAGAECTYLVDVKERNVTVYNELEDDAFELKRKEFMDREGIAHPDDVWHHGDWDDFYFGECCIPKTMTCDAFLRWTFE